MSSVSCPQGGQQRKEIMPSYVTTPAAASLAIIPSFYGFVVKSAQQLGETPPKWKFQHLIKGAKAAPVIGATIGTQLLAQRGLETLFTQGEKQGGKKASFASMLASTAVVGAVSAPLLAVFNDQANNKGRSFMQSVRRLSLPQMAVLLVRESCFLFGQRVVEPVSEQAKASLGKDNLAVELSASFLGGAAGHPADTVFTRLQQMIRGKALEQLKNACKLGPLMAGALPRTLAVANFSVGFAYLNKLFNPQTNQEKK